MSIIFVDVEAHFDSPCPGIGGGMTEFGAVEFKTRQTFHGLPGDTPSYDDWPPKTIWDNTFFNFEGWLKQFEGHPIFFSDNPAYDWQWINYWFHHTIHRNPFGHSARRIGDFYAGLVKDLRKASEWKKYRVTKHDHNPVNDAMGNAEAFEKILLLHTPKI